VEYQLLKAIRGIAGGILGAVCLTGGAECWGQIVINEVVKEQRDGLNDGASINPDVREFIELYNAGNSPVDLTGWTINQVNITNGASELTDTIPSGMLPAGGYFVIGSEGVPEVDFTPISGEIFADIVPRVLELRDGTGVLRDAVGYDVFRAGTTGLTMLTDAQRGEIGSGFQGELFSLDQAAPNIPASWSRYRDGRDTNKNGHDFGMLPVTPGASNNVPEVPSHAVPDVNALSAGENLSQYHASFVLPRVINPTMADANNPRALPGPSPQGGNAIIAWDPAFGGNAVHGKELVNSYNMYAYFDTAPLGVGDITDDQEWESSIYGIGSTDPFFRNPDPTAGIGQVPAGGAEPVTRNSSTGVGWLYQRFEDGSAAPLPGFTKLMLVDFGDGGDSEAAGEWEILHTIDMTTVTPGWYQLGIDYDPATKQIVGSFNYEEFSFTLDYDLLGTFFVGYREAITGTSANAAAHDPPTFDLFVSGPAGLAGDYNDNGTVDAADYVVWRENMGTNNTLPNNELPGPIGMAHYDQWRANFGSGGSAVGLAAGVPEPASLALAVICLFAGLGWRKLR
jgi:hypothetical protein